MPGTPAGTVSDMHEQPRHQAAGSDTAARDHLRFVLALHQQLAGHGENSCFSPYSVASALSVLAVGAGGQTARELTNLLTSAPEGFGGHDRLLIEAAQLPAREGQEQPVLAVSNTLWAWDELPVHETFRADLASWPSGAVKAAPFRADPEAARQTINADVAEVTHGLISELLPPGAVDEDTVASLVNALYLRVSWLTRFAAEATSDGDFHAPDGTVRVPMMAQTEQLGYIAHRGWQAVGLPALGGVQAVVLLPDGALAEQESELDVGLLGQLLEGMDNRSVDLRLPKLRLDAHTPLNSILRALGVRTMFTSGADLSGISGDDRLYVDSVLHQAVLRVDESGLEGAAATAAMMRLVSLSVDDPVMVSVDRPFLLLVRHVRTGAVYFLARVARP